MKVNREFLQVQRPNNGSVAGNSSSSSDGDKVGGGTVPVVPPFTPAAAMVVQELELLCAKPSETGLDRNHQAPAGARSIERSYTSTGVSFLNLCTKIRERP